MDKVKTYIIHKLGGLTGQEVITLEAHYVSKVEKLEEDYKRATARVKDLLIQESFGQINWKKAQDHYIEFLVEGLKNLAETYFEVYAVGDRRWKVTYTPWRKD